MLSPIDNTVCVQDGHMRRKYETLKQENEHLVEDLTLKQQELESLTAKREELEDVNDLDEN